MSILYQSMDCLDILENLTNEDQLPLDGTGMTSQLSQGVEGVSRHGNHGNRRPPFEVLTAADRAILCNMRQNNPETASGSYLNPRTLRTVYATDAVLRRASHDTSTPLSSSSPLANNDNPPPFSSLNNTEIFSDLSPRHKVKVRSNQGMSNSSSSHRANATNGISASGGGGGGGGGVKVAKKYSYDGFDYTFISRLAVDDAESGGNPGGLKRGDYSTEHRSENSPSPSSAATNHLNINSFYHRSSSSPYDPSNPQNNPHHPSLHHHHNHQSGSTSGGGGGPGARGAPSSPAVTIMPHPHSHHGAHPHPSPHSAVKLGGVSGGSGGMQIATSVISGSVPPTPPPVNSSSLHQMGPDPDASTHQSRKDSSSVGSKSGKDQQQVLSSSSAGGASSSSSKSLEENVLENCDLYLYYQLGVGNFGVVMQGVLRNLDSGKERSVAVKILRCSEEGEQSAESSRHQMLREAKVMSELNHPNVIKLIGIFNGPELMLVSELAPIGQLNKYLKKHKNVPVEMLMNYALQVANGMAYLERKSFVHRDLAARNVLLATDRHARISDFGMSRMLSFNKDYYRANDGGHWPVRWYAPQCIYFFTFTSKSDVWSYGVTLWEIFSYGQRPYGNMRSSEILDMIDRGARLKCPPNCPPEMYSLMLRCWEYEETDRPTFEEIYQVVEIYFRAQASKCRDVYTG
ncbi:uncharacterized protein LOC142335881 isoform X3 [Convolutriloba macropyga]|uniref:uncharacterized protein LOC142335881 isoform X3 n=1 Tax=Convolutriloba macropyga TaxID=536237 RepID=UPI003F51D594